MGRLGINHDLQITSIRYHKDWIKDKIKYRVLAAHQLQKERRDAAMAAVKVLVTGDEAQAFAIKEARTSAFANQAQEWQYVNMDPTHMGRSGVLKYRGVEIALYYKRPIMEIEPGIGEKPPEMQITDPADAWVRQDLLGPSAKKANSVLKKYHTELETLTQAQAQEIILLKERYAKIETELNVYVMRESRKKELAEEQRKAALLAKSPRHKRAGADRLCLDCKCYENYHNFDKKGKCLGCDGGKPKCAGCTFRPKGVRRRKVVTGVKVAPERKGKKK